MFQFHEGPIKTSINEHAVNIFVVFQFHEGPIKTHLQKWLLNSSNGFNSMKVRLKLFPRVGVLGRAFSFNSMKVRLKLVHSLQTYSNHVFQFHEGPIKTQSIAIHQVNSEVSIP